MPPPLSRLTDRERWSDPLGRMQPSLLFLLTWVLLPNLPFLALWVTGGPIRSLSIILYLLIGLLARSSAFGVIATLYVAAVVYDVFTVLSGAFNLSVFSLVYALEYATTLRPFASATYVLFGVTLLTSTVLVLWLAKRFRPVFPTVPVGAVALVSGAIMVVDLSVNLSFQYRFGRYVAQAAPFDSAIKRSGLMAARESKAPRNLLIVMVESWGLLENPEERAFSERAFSIGEIGQRYSVEKGETPFYGSTTSAELRELCGEWAFHHNYVEKPNADCLPARLREQGYRTVAFHGFSGEMFDRKIWYPNIGFEERQFGEQLLNPGDKVCRGVFTGACDTEIAEDVAKALVGPEQEPRFVYWLTLNSHLPIHPGTGDVSLGCKAENRPFESKQVCLLAEMWVSVFERVAKIATRDDLPTTDILIVGDHPPPFWTHKARGSFVAGKVPWVLLRAEDGRMGPRQAVKNEARTAP